MNNKITLDVKANRQTRKYTALEQWGRVLWGVAHVFFRYSPRQLWAWRKMILRAFGARIGAQAHIYPTVTITIPWNLDIGDYATVGDRAILYALGPIRIGQRSTISQGAHLCAGTHNYRDPTMPLLKLPIEIGDDVWICADTFIGPGTRVGDRAIVGARAVVVKDVPADVLVAGNPARVIGEREAPARR
jgi:putative colanic acid biosynthesis acetyltransferase WcaF